MQAAAARVVAKEAHRAGCVAAARAAAVQAAAARGVAKEAHWAGCWAAKWAAAESEAAARGVAKEAGSGLHQVQLVGQRAKIHLETLEGLQAGAILARVDV